MAKLGDVYVLINGDDKALRSTFARNERETRSWATRVGSSIRGALSTALSTAAGFITAQIGLQAITRAVAGLREGVLDFNGTLQTTELQFTTFMGDADRAREHVQMLFDFAKATPFETQPIIDASLRLQQFGGDALNSEENLTLLGDAAAATNAPLEELSRWVGRFYSAIQAGQPVGEATLRLLELAVLSPQARAEIERLTEAGADASEVWRVLEADLGRFEGAMGRQANTMEGLRATVSDTWQILLSTAGRPVFDLAQRVMKSLAQMLDSEGVEQAAQRIAQGLQGVIDGAGATLREWIRAFTGIDRETVTRVGHVMGYLNSLGTFMVSWGLNIGRMLAQGIRLAVGYVTYALQFLGTVISSFLKPGSPPRLLPDLDKWGTGAAEAWLEGWLEADFQTLEEFGGLVSGLLQNMAAAGRMDEAAVLPITLGVRRAFAEILQAAKETGAVSEGLFAAIRREAGPAGEEVEGLARRYARVAIASGRLAAIQAELAAMDRQDEAVDYAGRMGQLEEILADPRTTEAQRQRAERELKRTGLLREQSALEGELSEAERELAAYQGRLQIEQETLGIMGQQVQMAEALKDALEEALEPLTGGGGTLEDALGLDALGVTALTASQRLKGTRNDLAELAGFDLSEFSGDLDEMRTAFQTAYEEGQLAFDGLVEGAGPLRDTLNGLGAALDTWQGRLDSAELKLAEIREELGLGGEAAQRAQRIGNVLFALVDLRWLGPIRRMREAWTDLKASWAELRETAAPLIDRIDEIADAIDRLGDAIGFDIGSGVRAIWDALDTQLLELLMPMNPFVRIRVIIEGVQSAVDFLRGAIELLLPVWDRLRGVEPSQVPTLPGDEPLGYSRLASGTSYARGGWTMVGEMGREMMYVPEGARILSAGQTAQMLGGRSQQIFVTVPGVTVRNEQDVAELAYEVAREINRRAR